MTDLHTPVVLMIVLRCKGGRDVYSCRALKGNAVPGQPQLEPVSHFSDGVYCTEAVGDTCAGLEPIWS